MKASNFREMTQEELGQKLNDLKTEFFNLRFQLATGQLSNPMMIKQVKRDIARVKTILCEKEAEKIAK